MSSIGYINQFESMGNLDGPGTRFVMFLQGCMLRCKYCHNPETFQRLTDKEYEYTVDDVVSKVMKLKSYYRNGGVTISGGEPLLQMEFVLELVKKLKTNKFHVAIDTSGVPFRLDDKKTIAQFDKLIEYVDLFLVDIKHINSKKCQELTNFGNKNTLDFLEYLKQKNKTVWIRYVLVPGITDEKSDLIKTGKLINSMPNIENVDILPYHSMARAKWDKLGLEYQLDKVSDASKKDVNSAYKVMFNL